MEKRKKRQAKVNKELSFLKKLFSHYLQWYGLYNFFISILILMGLGSGYVLLLVGFEVFELIHWKKNVFNFRLQNKQFMSMVESYHTVCFVGAIRTGKSSLAWYLLNKFCKSKSLIYTSVKNPGYKSFTHDHLKGKVKLEEGSCCFVDEAGGMYDSFTYGTEFSEERKGIMNFNKYYGQNYGNDAFLYYIDQSSANMNTVLKRSVVYYVLNLSVVPIAMPLIPGMIYNLLNAIFHFTTYNIFNLVGYNYKDFVKLDDFAEHYEVNYDALTDKRYIVPAFQVFSTYDTRVFKEYNRGEYDIPYEWGTSKVSDELLMKENYSLVSESEKEKINIKATSTVSSGKENINIYAPDNQSKKVED